MTRLAAFLACLISVHAEGQTADPARAGSSLRLAYHQRDKLLDSLNRVSLFNRYRDSLHINTWSDNLRRDSLTINAWSDCLRGRIHNRFSTVAITNHADSLRKLGIPEPAITSRTDSLLRQKISMLDEVAGKQEVLQKNVKGRYTAWTVGLRRSFSLDSAGVRPPASENAVSPPRASPNFDKLGAAPGLPQAEAPGIQPMPALGLDDFSSIGVSPELASIGGSMTIPTAPQFGEWQKSLPSMPDPMGEINKQAGGLKELVGNPSEAAEKAVGQVSEVKGATKDLSEAEQLKKNSEALKAAEQPKDPGTASETVKQQAIDHFAGKEAEVQGAMSQMAKYKRKYSSLGSLSEIKKNDWLPHNGLKGKPFKERFRVGMNLGYKAAGDTLIFDFYPNASYRITGRLEAGLGAIYLVRTITTPFGFDQRNPVWGISSFVILKTFKSVFLRCEMDGNSFPISGSADRHSYRDWRWSFLTGVQTNFKISKKWKGNVQMLYNFDSSLKDGFPERMAARVGVLYSLSK